MSAAAARAGRLSGHILWVDATANASWLNNEAKVEAVVAKSARANIHAIVVDIKPISGQVLYESSIAPRMREWNGILHPFSFDILQAFLSAGAKAGIPIYASINTFSEGHKSFGVGPAYENPDWQVVSFTPSWSVSSTVDDGKHEIARVNESPRRDEIAFFDAPSDLSTAIRPGDVIAIHDDSPRWIDVVETDAERNHQTQPGQDRSPDAAGPDAGLPISIPAGGGALLGRGRGGEWLARRLRKDDAVRYEVEKRLLRAADSPSERAAVFTSPIHPVVRKRILSLVEEIVTRYPVHGLFLDRMRYPNLTADFSERSRQSFERSLHRKVNRWPEDVIDYAARPGSEPVHGPLFREWLAWRAGTIRSFLEDARRVVRKARRNAQVGVYVGSWYSVYYDVGVNWGSPSLEKTYDWMLPEYRSAGYAPLLDVICAGTYYQEAWMADAVEKGASANATVEGSSREALEAVRDETILYGSLYLIQYRNNPDAFREAIRASLTTTGGVMLFDLVYLERYGWWSILEEELPAGRDAPHLVPGFRDAIRRARHATDRERKIRREYSDG